MMRAALSCSKLPSSSAFSSCATSALSSRSRYDAWRVTGADFGLANGPQSRQIWSTAPVCMGRKAAKIAQKKNKEDAKRTKIYGKFGKMIVSAVKEGGGADPVTNLQLAKVLSQAKDMSVPKELIDRNIKRASDTKQGNFMELTYEAYGHGGVGIVMEILTDNVNRAAAETRTAVNKGGGKMADSGSVLFNFERKGVIVLDTTEDKEDEVIGIATDANAEDVSPREDGEEGFTVTTSVPDFIACQRALAEAGFSINPDQTALKMIPLAAVEVDDETADANDALMDRLLELDDVDAVYTQ